MSDGELTHFDASGGSRMVDVSTKPITAREAVAVGRIELAPATLQLICDRRISKGDVFEIARIAGIGGAKRTADLIPLCHPLPLDGVAVTLTPVPPNQVEIRAHVKCEGKTGVEMEALTAVSVACLTVYDMCKAVDRSMRIVGIELELKTGGRSGTYRRADQEAPK